MQPAEGELPGGRPTCAADSKPEFTPPEAEQEVRLECFRRYRPRLIAGVRIFRRSATSFLPPSVCCVPTGSKPRRS